MKDLVDEPKGYVEALKEKGAVAKKIVDTLVQLGGESRIEVVRERSYTMCQTAQTEVCISVMCVFST